jgi:hypothetical protein
VRLEELEEAHPEAAVELWAEDEARLGLKPVIRRVWAPVGKRPIAPPQEGLRVDLRLWLCATRERGGVLAGPA